MVSPGSVVTACPVHPDPENVGDDARRTPLITIAITCFNAQDTIARAIRSALEQDWGATEILVVDDGSTDASRDVVRGIAGTEPKVRLLVHSRNMGYPSALNTLLAAAKGQYIAFFDDDDKSRADRLRQQLDRLRIYEAEHPDKAVFCYCNRDVVAQGSDISTEVTHAIGHMAPEPHGAWVIDFLLLLRQEPPFVWGEFGSCTLMTRPETILALGGFDPEFRRMAEWDMAIRAAREDAHFIAVDAPLVTQYKTGGEAGEKSGRTPLIYALKLREKHKHDLKARGLYRASRAMAHVRFHHARGAHGKKRAFALAAVAMAPRKMGWQIFGNSRFLRGVNRRMRMS